MILGGLVFREFYCFVLLHEFLTQSATVKECHRCSQEQRARDAERKRLARRVVATATGPDAVERRGLVRE